MSGKPHDQDLFRPRSPGGSRSGTAAAVLVHLLLVGAIALGVNWRSSEPDGVSAELWSAVPQAAAPRATTPEAEPPAPAKPQPTPAPAPPPPPPTATRPEPPARTETDAQIAVEARRKEEARKKAELEERREQERKKQREEARKEEQRLAEERERQKALRDLKAQKERETREREQEKEKEKAREQAEALAEKKRDEQEALKKKQAAAAAAAAENARLEAQRKQALERIKGMAGASGGPTDTGSAAQSSGPSSSYGGRIRARVKPNIVFNEQVDGNPVAEVEVRLAPDGRILSQRLVRSSGVRAWDEAVQRAVERTEVFPRDVDGRVPSVPILLTFRPRD